MQLPKTFPGPTTAFKPGVGKAEVMGCGFVSSVCAAQANGAVAALRAMGWTVPNAFDGQNSPQTESGFIDRALQNKLDGIILASVDPSTIKTAIDRAISAKLPIICNNCASGTFNGKGVTDVSPDWKEQGVIAAWQVLSEQGDKAKVQTFADKQFLSAVLRSVGFQETIKANCSSCKVTYHDFPSSDYGKAGPPLWSAVLSSNSKGSITNAVPHYDGLGITVAKTNAQASRTEIKTGSYDGDPEAINALVTGSPAYDFTVSQPIAYEWYAGADLLGRMKAGAPLWTGSDKLPNVLVTAANAKDYVVNGQPIYVQPTGDWRANFLKLWGKS
jgi:ABC-type sugar transport system substrate-binding protein